MLDRIAAFANSSPNANFIMDSGIENVVGRDRSFPKVSVKSAFVIGFGETTFTGPDSATVDNKHNNDIQRFEEEDKH